MLAKMTEANRSEVLTVFAAVRSHHGDNERNDVKCFEALHYLTVHNIT